MSLHQLVLEAAARHPERVAVSGPDATVTYRELSQRADALAGRLAAQHVGVGDRVVVWASKSAECVAAMQAVLRLGAAYVPVDGSTPRPGWPRSCATARRRPCAPPPRTHPSWPPPSTGVPTI